MNLEPPLTLTYVKASSQTVLHFSIDPTTTSLAYEDTGEKGVLSYFQYLRNII